MCNLILSSNKLFEEPYFHHVEKIKTIGSCYMAASGLAPDKQVGDFSVCSLFPFVLSALLLFVVLIMILSPCMKLYIYLCLLQKSMDEWNHLSELVLFALAMQETLKEIIRNSTQRFQLRVGKKLPCLGPTKHTRMISSVVANI